MHAEGTGLVAAGRDHPTIAGPADDDRLPTTADDQAGDGDEESVGVPCDDGAHGDGPRDEGEGRDRDRGRGTRPRCGARGCGVTSYRVLVSVTSYSYPQPRYDRITTNLFDLNIVIIFVPQQETHRNLSVVGNRENLIVMTNNTGSRSCRQRSLRKGSGGTLLLVGIGEVQ